MTKKKWKIVRTKQFQEQFNKLPLDKQAEIEKAMDKIAENPYDSEPSKPCPSCGEYFFHSDVECPFCGAKLGEQAK